MELNKNIYVLCNSNDDKPVNVDYHLQNTRSAWVALVVA